MTSILGKRIERPPYLGALILATLTYLLTELAFNAHLLDVAGGVSDIHDIEKVEHVGRLISGVAAALALCGSFVCPMLARRGATATLYIGVCAIVGAPVVAGVYFGEKALVDALVARSTAEERRAAALLSMASHQLRRDGISVRGIDLSAEVLATPEGKAFVALLSPIVFQLPEVEQVVDRQLGAIVRQVVADKLGGLNGYYDKAYAPSLKKMEEFFGQYADAVNRYNKSAGSYAAEAEKAWNSYVAKLRKYGMTPDNVSPAYHDRVRREVRSSGVPVSKSWNPADQRGFLLAFRDAYQSRLKAGVNDGMRSAGLAPGELPLTLATFEQFLGHPAIQKRWKEQIGAEGAGTLRNNMSRPEFDKAVFAPMVERIAKKTIADLTAEARFFERGERMWELGEEAMRAVVVPPLALGLSILGAIVHLCKVTMYASRAILPYSRVGMASLALFIALVAAPFGLTNEITETETYGNVERIVIESGNPAPHAFRWVIQSQSYAYPVNDGVRKALFKGTF